MKFRLATTEDIFTIKSLRMQMLQEVAMEIPEGLPAAITKYLEKHIKDNTCICAFLEENGTIAAKAMLCVNEAMPDEENVSGKYARLFSVYTLPEFRGHGYMEELLKYLLEEARKCGIQDVFASAEKKAMPLYKRIGFITSETEMQIKVI